MESKERERIQEGNYPNVSNYWKKVLSHINGDKDVKIYKIHKKKYHGLFYSSMKKVQDIMCLIVMVDF